LGGGLVVKGSELTDFEVAGKDGKFYPAKATIEGGTVVATSSKVNAPVAVRYGWASNPQCNLYNKADLPASPFTSLP
jgi:sialate O-acetylesterase